MVFGRFQGDKRLDAQKDGLSEAIRQLEDLERGLRRADDLYDAFAEFWGDGVPEDIPTGLGKARQLADLLALRVNMAKRELPSFDDDTELLRQRLTAIDQRWKAFVAILFARQTIAQSEPPVRNPDTEACQRALIGVAEDLNRELRGHIDELAGIKPRFTGPWPEGLDLAKMEAGMADVRGALDTYRERLGDGQGELPEASTVTLMDLISMMQASVAEIEDQRVQLAAHTVISAAMRNTGLA